MLLLSSRLRGLRELLSSFLPLADTGARGPATWAARIGREGRGDYEGGGRGGGDAVEATGPSVNADLAK